MNCCSEDNDQCANLPYLGCEVSGAVKLLPNHCEIGVTLRLRRHAKVALLNPVARNSACLHAHL